MPDLTDQRVLRGIRNRAAIVDAMVTLVKEGELSPTADQIAARAGVARRSVYHHFKDLDGVTVAVTDQYLVGAVQVESMCSVEGPLRERCRAFSSHRCTLAERLLPVYRSASRSAQRNHVIADQLAATDGYLRDELCRTFAQELRGAPSWVVETLDAMTSLDGWVRLRVNQRLSPRRARNVVQRTLTELLAG